MLRMHREDIASFAPCRLHLLTKHRVFSGPGFHVAQEIGDAAHGGQVVISHEAWLELRNCMDQVSVPQDAFLYSGPAA